MYKSKYLKYCKKIENLLIQKEISPKFLSYSSSKNMSLYGGSMSSMLKYYSNLEARSIETVSNITIKSLEKMIYEIEKKDLNKDWFASTDLNWDEFLQDLKDNSKVSYKKKIIDKLLAKLKIDYHEFQLLIKNIVNYNEYIRFFLIGDPQKKRDLDLLVHVSYDPTVSLSEVEYQKLITDLMEIPSFRTKIQEDKMDINYINMDDENNLIQSSKGAIKFTQNILVFTYSMNIQKYILEPMPKPFLPDKDPFIRSIELINYVSAIQKRFLDGLKVLFPVVYNQQLSKLKGAIYNSTDQDKLNFVEKYMNIFLTQNLGKPITEDQQEIFKSITIKILQLILWENGIIKPEFFSKEGALDLVLGLGVQLNKSEVMSILYIKASENIVTISFQQIWIIFMQIAPNYLWELPGTSKQWTPIKVNPIDSNVLFNLIRINAPIGEVMAEYAKHFPIPRDGDKLILQTNFVDILDPIKIKKIQELLKHLTISDLNPRSLEWIRMINHPDLKFGSNSGIKVYTEFPDWKIQFQDNYYLLLGLIAEMDVLRLINFDEIFKGSELIEVGAIIEKGYHKPLLGVCPDGLLLLPDKTIIPIEIKKIKVDDKKAIQRELDLAARQLSHTKNLINSGSKYSLVKHTLMILYDFYNQVIYFRVI
jgi:hypothetical protein